MEKVNIKDIFEESLEYNDLNSFVKRKSIQYNVSEHSLSYSLLNYAFTEEKEEELIKKFEKNLSETEGIFKEFYIKREAFYLFLKGYKLDEINKRLPNKIDVITSIAQYNKSGNEMEKNSMIYALYKTHNIGLFNTFSLIDFKKDYYKFISEIAGKEIINGTTKRKVDIIDLIIDLDFSFDKFKKEYKYIPQNIKSKILLFFVREGLNIKHGDFDDAKDIDSLLNKEYSIKEFPLKDSDKPFIYNINRDDNKKIINYLIRKGIPVNEVMIKKVLDKCANGSLNGLKRLIKMNLVLEDGCENNAKRHIR